MDDRSNLIMGHLKGQKQSVLHKDAVNQSLRIIGLNGIGELPIQKGFHMSPFLVSYSYASLRRVVIYRVLSGAWKE